ncbi:unnamed protein product [Somion occarium]|uniref:F-box domain-containing protein n=1 Tax=Somion occarium TaxID=3059160 RepID=A0ABP1DVU8_9APHY
MVGFWTRIRQAAGIWINPYSQAADHLHQDAFTQPTSHITPFPREFFPEIVDLILDHLHDDKASLKACSLVCKAWLTSCRFHLFYELHVPYCTTIADVGFEPFADFLYDHPSVRGFIRKLVLKADDERLSEEDLRAIHRGTAQIGPYLLVSICNMLPALHSLRLFMLDWQNNQISGTQPWGVTTSPFPPIRPLQTLSLSVVYTSLPLQHIYEGDKELSTIDVLRYFSDVKKLTMSRVSTISDIEAPYPLRLQTLAMYHVADMDRWTTFFKRARVSESIRSIGFAFNSLRSPIVNRSPLGDWLHEEIGPKLHELSLSLLRMKAHEFEDIISHPWESLGLDACVNVRSITFMLEFPDSQTSLPWALVLYTLSNIPSRDLDSLHITFERHTKQELPEIEMENRMRGLDWESLSKLRFRFKNLRQPVVTLSQRETYWHSKNLHAPSLQNVFDAIRAEWFQ